MTEKPEQARGAAERPAWKLNRDEQRTMYITLVGGLGSIILGAVVLGLAIALAHYLRAHSHAVVSASHIALIAVAILALAASGALLARRKWKRAPHLEYVYYAAICLVTAVIVLALIGLLAGLK